MSISNRNAISVRGSLPYEDWGKTTLTIFLLSEGVFQDFVMTVHVCRINLAPFDLNSEDKREPSALIVLAVLCHT